MHQRGMVEETDQAGRERRDQSHLCQRRRNPLLQQGHLGLHIHLDQAVPPQHHRDSHRIAGHKIMAWIEGKTWSIDS